MRLSAAIAAGLVAITICLILLTRSQPSAAAPRFFSESFLGTPLDQRAALAPDGERLVNELRNMALGARWNSPIDCLPAVGKARANWTPDERRWCDDVTISGAGVNRDEFAPPLYLASPDTRTVRVRFVRYDGLPKDVPDLQRAFEAVPIPAGADPASGSDGTLIVYQASTDTMWELWKARRDPLRGWLADWGGRMRNVSARDAFYRTMPVAPPHEEQHTWGGPSARIPNLPGLILLSELQQGTIGHGLVLAVPKTREGIWAWPAQGTDGAGPSAIMQGQRFRLAPWFDTGRIANRAVRAIARAAQLYGLVVNNGSGAVSFMEENWRPRHWSDPNPALWDGDNVSFVMKTQFPWHALQALARPRVCRDPAQPCLP
jgi:hypothetical protein